MTDPFLELAAWSERERELVQELADDVKLQRLAIELLEGIQAGLTAAGALARPLAEAAVVALVKHAVGELELEDELGGLLERRSN